MLLIIPEIKLNNGICTLCVKGINGTETLYTEMSEDPLELCRLWRRENAKTLHITDENSLQGEYNRTTIDSILFIAKSVDIPVQALSYTATVEDCKYLLDNGVYRVLIDDLALTDPRGVKNLMNKYSSSRLIFVVRVKDGVVRFRFIKNFMLEIEFIQYLKELGATRIVYEDENWNNQSPTIVQLKKIAEKINMKTTLYGGVGSPQQLWALQSLSKTGIDSVIIGSPLYDNNFPCQKIWRMIEAEVEGEGC